jgi:hypothetical protein
MLVLNVSTHVFMQKAVSVLALLCILGGVSCHVSMPGCLISYLSVL